MYSRLGSPAFPLHDAQDVPARRLNSCASACSKFPLPHLSDQQQIRLPGHKKGLPSVGPPNLVSPHLYPDSSVAYRPDPAEESIKLSSSADLDDFPDDNSDRSGGFVQRGGSGRAAADANLRITTVMLCNIPCHVDRKDILRALEGWGFADKVDFIHLPKSTSSRYKRYGNIGYSFINFMTAEDAEHFVSSFPSRFLRGLPISRRTQNTLSVPFKKCTVRLAHLQGYNAKIESAQMKPLEKEAADAGRPASCDCDVSGLTL